MKALVTGATGLVGMHIVRGLLEEGHGVRALVRPTSDLRGVATLPIETVQGDVLDLASLRRAASGCDVLFHAAAHFTYWGDALNELEDTALRGTANVLKAASSAKVSRVVVTSSSVIFGYGDDPSIRDEQCEIVEDQRMPLYVWSKIRQDKLALEKACDLGLDLILVCPTMAVGPAGPTLGPSNALLVTYLADPFRLTYPGGCNIVAARDVGRGHVLAAMQGESAERYILGGENLEYATLHKIVADLCGVSQPALTASHATSFLGASLEELKARVVGRPPITTRAQATMLGRYYWYSHEKAATIGYSPRSAREAIAIALSSLVASSFVSREARARIRLSAEVHTARRALAADEVALRLPS